MDLITFKKDKDNVVHITNKDKDENETCCGKALSVSHTSHLEDDTITCKACIQEVAMKAYEGDRRYDDLLRKATKMYEDRQEYWLGLIREHRAVVIEAHEMKEECAGLRFSKGNVINSKDSASMEYFAGKDAKNIFFLCKVVVIKEFLPEKVLIYKEEEGGSVNHFDLGCGHNGCTGE